MRFSLYHVGVGSIAPCPYREWNSPVCSSQSISGMQRDIEYGMYQLIRALQAGLQLMSFFLCRDLLREQWRKTLMKI